jgi:8-hydroxy-5-deazaflavin:NADPH oxidoreductase
MENSAACAAADILVLTVPFEGQATLLKQLKPAIRPGSILIDATVALAAGVGGRASRTLGVWQGSAAQQAAELVPKGVSVAAAFHNLSADLLNGDEALDCDVIVCSDDANAAQLTRRSAAKIPGVRAIDGGKAGECPHPRADHRAAHRTEHSPQRPRRHPHHWPAAGSVPLEFPASAWKRRFRLG